MKIEKYRKEKQLKKWNIQTTAAKVVHSNLNLARLALNVNGLIAK